MPLRTLGQHGDACADVRAGLEVRELLAIAAAPFVAGADAEDAAVGDEQLVARRLRQNRCARLLGLLAKPAPELRQRSDVVALVLHRRRRHQADGVIRSEEVHRLVLDDAEERKLFEPLAFPEEPLEPARVDHRSGEEMRARLLPFLEHGDRDVAEPVGELGLLLEQLPEADGARKSGGAGAYDQHSDLDLLVRRIGRCRDVAHRVERRWMVGGLHDPLRARTSSVSFGTISCRSPTTPRSLNSKMGAFGSLLIATMTPEPCIPTLCWIAPEIPQAT